MLFTIPGDYNHGDKYKRLHLIYCDYTLSKRREFRLSLFC